MRRPIYFPYFILLATAFGCSSEVPSSDAESLDENITVRPQGTGDLATVTIHLPDGYRPTVPALDAHFEFVFNNTSVTPETATKVLPTKAEGHLGCLEITLVKGKNTRIARSIECTYPLAAGETKTFDLSLLRLWWTNYPNAWASMMVSEARGTPMLARMDGQNAYSQWVSSGEIFRYAINGYNDIALPVAPGAYRYSIEGSTLPPFTFDVPEGVQVDRNAAYDDFLSFVDIGYPDHEGFDNANANASRVTLTCPGARREFVPNGAPGPLSVSILGGGSGITSCTYEVNGFKGALSLQAKSHTAFELARLNVDDVELTDEGGAKVPGVYWVRRYDPPTDTWGAWSASAKTKTGLDLPHGQYQILVRYEPHGRAQERWLFADL